MSALLHSDKIVIKKIISELSECLDRNGLLAIDLKFSNIYRKETREDKFGVRTFYYYAPELITRFSKGKYKVLSIERQKIGKTDWFVMILQKK